jgi:hypothetical protein
MSPTDAGSFTDAATVPHLAGPFFPTPPRGDHACVQDGALARDPRPSRPVAPPPVGRSRNLHPSPFNDPCNYLG